MRLPASLTRLQPKLLLSHLLVMAVGIAGVVLGVQLIGPSIFDRLLVRHMGGPGGMMDGGMTAAMQNDTNDVFRTAIFQTLVLATIVATLAAVLISLFVSRRITTPITRMADTSRRIAGGDYGVRVVPAERDELGELANSLNAMAAALEENERRRVRLIGDVAHEVRTPLATLRGSLEGLLDGAIELAPELFAQLHDETGRLQRLVDDLQELSQVEAGDLSLTLRPVSPQVVVDAALARLAAHYDAKGVVLRTEIPEGLPDAIADEDRIVQVLTNLLSNALRYTPPGGAVTVVADTIDDTVRLDVRDTGIGIQPEHLAHVFERFYRVDPARSRALGGSGVGLTIARALVEAQGGRIRAGSAGAGQGSTFSVMLPRA